MSLGSRKQMGGPLKANRNPPELGWFNPPIPERKCSIKRAGSLPHQPLADWFALTITGKDSAATKLEGPPLGAQRQPSDDPRRTALGIA